MTPQIDADIGISVYTTSYQGCGGNIKTSVSDFKVKELVSKSTLKKIDTKGNYALFLLKKHEIDTNHALADIFKKTRIRLKALGLKDASAVTEQYVCTTRSGVNTSRLDDLASYKYSVRKLGYLQKPLSKKDMVGNHFTISIKNNRKPVTDFNEQDHVLNFFGYQRFGSKRPVTHLVGKAIVQRDFQKAIDLLLSYTSKYDDPFNTEIRNKLKDKSTLRQTLRDLPPKMDVERLVAEEWLKSGDPVFAIKAVPLYLRRFFVQSYQSHIFNQTLSQAYAAGESLFEPAAGDVCFDKNAILGKYDELKSQNLAIPLVGHSYYKKTRFDYYVSKILKEEEVSNKDFFIKELQEASSEGGFRHSSVLCHDFKAHDGNTLSFALSRGSYATILLREVMKPTDPINAGF